MTLSKEDYLSYLIDCKGYSEDDFKGMSTADLKKEVEDNHNMFECESYAY
jgi:hypothetical protein